MYYNSSSDSDFCSRKKFDNFCKRINGGNDLTIFDKFYILIFDNNVVNDKKPVNNKQCVRYAWLFLSSVVWFFVYLFPIILIFILSEHGFSDILKDCLLSLYVSYVCVCICFYFLAIFTPFALLWRMIYKFDCNFSELVEDMRSKELNNDMIGYYVISVVFFVLIISILQYLSVVLVNCLSRLIMIRLIMILSVVFFIFITHYIFELNYKYIILCIIMCLPLLV